MNVLAIGCHPDDVEIACAGTLAKCVKRGDKVIVAHLCNGSLGHVIIKPPELIPMRAQALVFPPLFLHSLPSLISNCLNLPFGIQEISRRLRISQVALVVKNPPAKVKVKSLSRVRLLATPWTAATRLLHPWDFPGKSTGVGCHCLLRLLHTRLIKIRSFLLAICETISLLYFKAVLIHLKYFINILFSKSTPWLNLF